jgi:hypothetical protein
VIGAWLLFGETFSGVQWLGVGVLLAGLYGLALYNMSRLTVARETLIPALWFAVLTGLFVALYTTYDAYGIRATADPFTFLAWFFFIDGLLYPFLAAAFYRRMEVKPALGPLALRGIVGRVHRLRELRVDHAGHAPRPGGRGGGAARNLHRLRRADRLAVPQGTRRTGARGADGVDRGRCGDS